MKYQIGGYCFESFFKNKCNLNKNCEWKIINNKGICKNKNEKTICNKFKNKNSCNKLDTCSWRKTYCAGKSGKTKDLKEKAFMRSKKSNLMKDIINSQKLKQDIKLKKNKRT